MFRRYRDHPDEAGLTLLELLIAMSIMVMVVGTLGSLAKGIQEGFEYADSHGEATQHARVVLDRITKKVREATANEKFPGAMVLDEWSGPWRFPDTLVVWAEGDPLDADGLPRLPRYNELRIYCPDFNEPNKLVEITPTDSRTVPWVEGSGVNLAQLTAEIRTIRQSAAGEPPLTDLMRTCPIGQAADSPRRGAVRFEMRLRPEKDRWADSGVAWDELDWAQGVYSSQFGLRQVWLRIELQVTPDQETTDDAGQRAVPFFGSAALYYPMYEKNRP